MNRQIHNKNNKVLTAFIDIDETICFYEGERIYEDAVPNLDNIEKINKLFEQGWKIIYWTARGSSDLDNIARLDYLTSLTYNQLTKWGCKFHHLKMGDEKPLYDLIIDDKAKRIEEI